MGSSITDHTPPRNMSGSAGTRESGTMLRSTRVIRLQTAGKSNSVIQNGYVLRVPRQFPRGKILDWSSRRPVALARWFCCFLPGRVARGGGRRGVAAQEVLAANQQRGADRA